VFAHPELFEHAKYMFRPEAVTGFVTPDKDHIRGTGRLPTFDLAPSRDDEKNGVRVRFVLNYIKVP